MVFEITMGNKKQQTNSANGKKSEVAGRLVAALFIGSVLAQGALISFRVVGHLVLYNCGLHLTTATPPPGLPTYCQVSLRDLGNIPCGEALKAPEQRACGRCRTP